MSRSFSSTLPGKSRIFLRLLKAVQIIYFVHLGKKDTLLMPKVVIKYILIVKQSDLITILLNSKKDTVHKAFCAISTLEA